MESNGKDEGLFSRYKATMVLSGVGDALGYHDSKWEFCFCGEVIHTELKALGGLKNISVRGSEWKVSDDTIMHIATGEALVEFQSTHSGNVEDLFITLAKYYKECMKNMSGRGPGQTCYFGTSQLRPEQPDGYKIKFNRRGGGCGGAMRSMCIGLLYWRENELDKLIEVSVEAGRMTHNHPTGYLGSVTSAFFTSLAIRKIPVKQWGAKLIVILPLVWNYIEKIGRDVEENKEHWSFFVEKWEEYLALRGIADGISNPKFPENFGIKERDIFYKSISFGGWGGASGHDATIIAYDSLLGGGENWEQLAHRGFFHSGDSDSTAAISGAWFGALYGFNDSVYPKNYQNVEFKDRLETIALELYNFANPD